MKTKTVLFFIFGIFSCALLIFCSVLLFKLSNQLEKNKVTASLKDNNYDSGEIINQLKSYLDNLDYIKKDDLARSINHLSTNEQHEQLNEHLKQLITFVKKNNLQNEKTIKKLEQQVKQLEKTYLSPKSELKPKTKFAKKTVFSLISDKEEAIKPAKWMSISLQPLSIFKGKYVLQSEFILNDWLSLFVPISYFNLRSALPQVNMPQVRWSLESGAGIKMFIFGEPLKNGLYFAPNLRIFAGARTKQKTTFIGLKYNLDFGYNWVSDSGLIIDIFGGVFKYGTNSIEKTINNSMLGLLVADVSLSLGWSW